jgi:GntR family transcriptional regulator/MocR family aminotransferase
MRRSTPKSPFIHIDARHGRQTQIYHAIRRAILDGSLQPGARLLSSRALADDLGVSRTTTLLAYEQLTAEGYLTPRYGSGTFVASELPDDLPEARRDAQHSPSGHPPLSNRGTMLSGLPTSARRLPGPPRAFRIGVPALDRFPHRLWAQLVNRRLRATTVAQLDYSDPAGQRSLREAIAAHVSAARGTTCTADQVIVVAGAQRGLELIFRALLDPGDEAVMEDPGYPGARNALSSAGGVPIDVRVDADGIDVNAIAACGGCPRVAYVTPSHQFPLGVPMSLTRRLALLRWARDAGAWIVEDDYDSEYRYGARPVPCLHGLATDGRVVYVGSFSKTLFPALRLGFLVVPTDLLASLASIRRATDLHPPAFEQLVVADMIADGHYDRHLRRMRAVCRERLDALCDAADRWGAGALRLRPVHTGLHAVADLAADIDLDRLLDEAATQQVEVMPLSAYIAERTTPPRALVLGFGSVEPNAVRRGMERLARALDASRRPLRSPRTPARSSAARQRR